MPPDTNESRCAFLVGEGTLTTTEVYAWARELGEPALPPILDSETPLMVGAVSTWKATNG